LQAESVDAAAKAVEIVHKQFKEGLVNYTPVFQVEQNLVQQQDTLAQARGEIATGLIHVYRALGGGWQLRCTGCETGGAKLEGAAPAEETAPLPRPEPAPFPKEGKAPGS
jgi:hypothetical protein